MKGESLMDKHYFMDRTKLIIRDSYFESAVIPMYKNSGMTEKEFCNSFTDLISDLTGCRIIHVTDANIYVLTDDFYQLHGIQEDYCTLLDLLNSCDDSVGYEE